MTLEMRELKGDDLFTLLSIVGKLDIKDEFVSIFEQNAEAGKVVPMDKKKKEPTKAEKAKAEAEAEKRGMEAMATLLQKVLMNIGKIKGDINALLADLTGKPLKEIQNLGLKEYTGLIIGFFKKEELKDFFSSIASLM
ncbi:hypothetical protein [Bacillus licheniformis]|uniref:hypothetical protein n=1 Tax=Bacillus licheniformis TaxID=1402 RepID=UPI000B8B21B9|nr:hypothetical protein [Bacillus licheniformis]MED0689958.1 hypothetical protein [Bacillus licheniformis]MED0713584.1 hypothetical protein [Bacillus licheniformis]MED0789299.1 hypothetical protein [Bacillus licheniformis]TWM10451.1 hypothetical protein CHCC15091_0948 [Bacillus licheniformis]WIW99382.1 hypothetical protein QQ984_03620 [Bacillus licheniformis]